jgi:hypothetical protein
MLIARLKFIIVKNTFMFRQLQLPCKYFASLNIIVFILIVILFALFSCRNRKAVNLKGEVNTGVEPDMKQRLKALNDNSIFPKNPNQSDQAILQMETNFNLISTMRDSMVMLRWLAYHNLGSGHSYKAVVLYSELKSKMIANHIPQLDTDFTLADIDREIAIARFRNSEQLNCQLGANANSCIFPFTGNAVHLLADDAKQSRAILLQLLHNNQHDEVSRWLLNIENSAIGYPVDSIPVAYRMNMSKYEAPVSFKPFNNVAIDAGVSASGLAGGAATEDFNHDGLMDIVVSSCGLYDPLRLFINKGNGTFEEQTKQAGLDGITGGLNLTTCDYNNDGWIDIFLMRGGWMEGYGNFPNSLLQNNGNGTFTDVTIQAGLYSLHPTHSSVWVDFNHDGWVDAFVGHETSDTADLHYSEFYINNRNGTFTECAEQAGLRISQFVKGTGFTDIDNDGWADIYVSVFGGKNILLKNNGVSKNNIPHFTDVTQQAGVEEPIFSFSVFSTDINNDGWDDLFAQGYMQEDIISDVASGYLGKKTASRPYVYINQKNGTYTDQSQQYHLLRSIQGMGLNFGDIDNDGYPDIYCGTGNPDFKALFPNVLLHNVNGKYFEDVTMQTRTGNLQKGHGIAFCDIDNDGDEDIYEDLGGFFKADIGNNMLFENPGTGNNYIGLLLSGCKSDKSCVGARIEIIITEAGKQRHIYKTVCTGGSFGSNSYRQLIGIGKTFMVDQINIYYPTTGIRQTFKNTIANKYYQVNECFNVLTELKLRQFQF